MIVRLFDPEGIDPRNYKTMYSELAETPEFESFGGRELLFIWYYANPTSPIIDMKNSERVQEAFKLSGWKPAPAEKERLLKMSFTDKMEKAIETMGNYEPGARYVAWMMVKKMFDEYQKMVTEGKTYFTQDKFDKEGNKTGEVFDHRAYVAATKDIQVQLPSLIDKLEKGFGISIIKKDESDEELEGGTMIRMWNQTKND